MGDLCMWEGMMAGRALDTLSSCFTLAGVRVAGLREGSTGSRGGGWPRADAPPLLHKTLRPGWGTAGPWAGPVRLSSALSAPGRVL